MSNTYKPTGLVAVPYEVVGTRQLACEIYCPDCVPADLLGEAHVLMDGPQDISHFTCGTCGKGVNK